MEIPEDEKIKVLMAQLEERYAASHKMRDRRMQFGLWILGLGLGMAWILIFLKGTLVQIQLCIAKEKILTAARQRGYRFKQKLTLPNGRSRIHLDAKITERFMT